MKSFSILECLKILLIEFSVIVNSTNIVKKLKVLVVNAKACISGIEYKYDIKHKSDNEKSTE